MLRKSVTVASAAVLALTLCAAVGPPAQAETSVASAACSLRLGSVTATGAHTSRVITATSPITIGGVRGTAGVFQPNQVQHTSTFVGTPLLSGESRAGLTVLGGALHSSTYVVDGQSRINPQYPHKNVRIGAGWSSFRWVEQSIHRPADAGESSRTTLYGQKTDGTVRRWVADGTVWRPTGSAGGLSAVKSMTLIGRSYTHDTFLANTRAGKLITVRWPTKFLSAPTAAPVRDATWQGFEQLIATQCGATGTLLLGIDRDTKSGYLYAVGHANGRSTVIRSLGKVPMTFPDPKYFRWAPKYDTLNGG